MRRHLEQLRDLDLDEELQATPSTTYTQLVKWTEDSQEQINTAIGNRVYGGANPGSQTIFKNAFFAFMESTAMYLRNNKLVLRAVQTYRLGNDIEGAFNLLDESVKEIDRIAEMWGMKFTMICDLVDKSPDGHKFIVGPFCGAFSPKDFSKPFIGIAFKGTSGIWEWLNNVRSIKDIKVSKDLLFGAYIASGFYYPIFSTYGQKLKSEPIVLIQSAISDLSLTGTSRAVIHVTGHSLGGAYGSLSYGQLVYKGISTDKAFLGDLYTFGAPRVGEKDFAEPFRDAVKESSGSTWRIVNKGDIVARVPALLVKWIGRPWVHIDSLYTVYPGQAPILGPTEIGTSPTLPFVTTVTPHKVTEYYKSLTFATTGQPPIRAPAQDLLNSQEAVDALGGIEIFKAAGSPPRIPESKRVDFGHNTIKNNKVVFESFSKCIRGTIQVGPLVGEVIGWGDVKELPSLSLVMDLQTNSLRALHDARETRVLISSHNSGTYIDFFLDDVVAAQGYIHDNNSSPLSEGALVNGTCTWELADTVEDLSTEWVKVSDEFHANLFAL